VWSLCAAVIKESRIQQRVGGVVCFSPRIVSEDVGFSSYHDVARPKMLRDITVGVTIVRLERHPDAFKEDRRSLIGAEPVNLEKVRVRTYNHQREQQPGAATSNAPNIGRTYDWLGTTYGISNVKVQPDCRENEQRLSLKVVTWSIIGQEATVTEFECDQQYPHVSKPAVESQSAHTRQRK
jgi:hypothetical protein